MKGTGDMRMRIKFPRVFGNESTKSRLASAIFHGTLSHAIMISGPLGSGRKTLLYSIAMALNCENKISATHSLPCGICNNCRRIAEGNFPDFKILKPAQGKSTIGADELRAFREDMFLSSTEAEHRIYAIDRAETMTTAAQNALLKVLEEPPKNVHIILITTGADKLLSTIRSRAQLIQTELFPPDDMKKYVTDLSDDAYALGQRDPARLRSILITSGGVIGRALAMLDEKAILENEERRRAVLSFISVLPKRTDFSKLYLAVGSLPKGREELTLILRDTVTALRDMIVTTSCDKAPTLFFITKSEAEEAMGNMTAARLVAVEKIINEALRDLERNVVISSLLTDIAVRIKEA